MKRVLLCIALAGVFGVAQAGNSNGCQGNCPGGDTVNNITNAGGAGGTGYGGTGVGIGIGQGGAGGQGGQGGAGGQGGIGIGGSVLGSGNSANTNRNDNRNTNLQGQLQGQQQGQAQGQAQGQQQNATAKQGQSQSSRNRNDNRSSASNSNSNANSGNNSAQAVTVQGDHYEAARIPVATAYAAPLVAGTGTCMGSTTVGGQGMTIGISVGSTWEDHGCTMRSNAATLYSLGQQKAAVALLCQDKSIAQAMKAAGTTCPGSESKAAPAVAMAPEHKATPAEAAAGYTGTDPIVRARLGLPPLK